MTRRRIQELKQKNGKMQKKKNIVLTGFTIKLSLKNLNSTRIGEIFNPRLQEIKKKVKKQVVKPETIKQCIGKMKMH